MNTIRVPQLAWYETKELELPLPDSWQVEVYNMAGYNRPAMKPDEIKASIQNPIGIPPIRELARGKKEVVIIFDDMTRVTRVAKIVPSVLEELAAAGIPDNRIRFIVALGLHATMWRQHFVKKLGEEVVARFPVYNHNPFGNCVYVDTTSTYKTKVYANEEVMKCDLKIAIGSVVPHPMNGFGGGGKIILPGVVSFETIDYNHRMATKSNLEHQDIPNAGMGIFDNNSMHYDVDEAANLVGLDVLINCVVNMWGETVAVHAGAMAPAHAAAVQESKTHYLTPMVKGKDIVIANTFAKVNETRIGLGIAYPAVNTGGGDVVLIANAPEGQVTHYLLGPFGKTTWAKQHQLFRSEVPQHVNHLIVYNEYPHRGSSWLDEDDKILYLDKWDDVLKLLQKSHGTDTKVAVYPNAEIQYCV